ncbi:MAG: nucleoside deaminase [Bacteroides sp.]|nr:nucleoside deaminase [Bacteroides sp.]
MDSKDERFMRVALEEAQKAAEAGEVPVGAVVVINDRIIGKGHNMTEALNDVTAHAEIIAITAAQNALGGKVLPDCTLYVTLEPCPMCAGAIGWARLKRIVWGADDKKGGVRTYYRPERLPFHPKSLVETGLLGEESAALLKSFFSARRH